MSATATSTATVMAFIYNIYNICMTYLSYAIDYAPESFDSFKKAATDKAMHAYYEVHASIKNEILSMLANVAFAGAVAFVGLKLIEQVGTYSRGVRSFLAAASFYIMIVAVAMALGYLIVKHFA
ncbi:hypothetical protein LTR15_005589 [Elasticomyces elasticus]|nr:hypothetical protein LTR15_005589 [Elasticomyces elasticus]